MDQAVKNIEDMQDDFDFCYKTLQSRGERRVEDRLEGNAEYSRV